MLLLTLLQYLGVLFMRLTLGQLGRKKKPEPPAQPAPAEG
jgi:hypothetical protein